MAKEKLWKKLFSYFVIGAWITLIDGLIDWLGAVLLAPIVISGVGIPIAIAVVVIIFIASAWLFVKVMGKYVDEVR